jgi:hypothetical protein
LKIGIPNLEVADTVIPARTDRLDSFVGGVVVIVVVDIVAVVVKPVAVTVAVAVR